jgi:hypothetical protein
VNVSTLVASSLELNGGDARFQGGILSRSGVTFGGDGQPGGTVEVAPGAHITIGSYGQAALFGGTVRNRGTIEAPDGQVLLAAGTGVSLSASAAADLRGYLATVTGGGVVENGGVVSTPRGNVTLVGDQVLQDGLVTATTGGEANGSILLSGSTRTVLTGQSRTQVLPDTGGSNVVGAASFLPSRVTVTGEKIELLDGANLYAPAGDVQLLASPASATGVTRVYVGPGAKIDVSGLVDVEVAMETNEIQAQLRANELRNNPLLRDNPAIRGRTVYFDGRLGLQVADVSGYYDLIERPVEQLMTHGGSVTLSADEVILRQGSVVDLSGGSLLYRDGWVRSSQLITETGARVRIEDAQPGTKYVGLDGDFVDTHARWGVTDTYVTALRRTAARWQQGYEEGGSAGRLTIGLPGNTVTPTVPSPDQNPTGAFRVLEGDVVAHTIVGPRQRALPTGTTDPTKEWREQPSGGVLVVNRAGDVTIADVGPQLAAGFRPDDPLDPAGKYSAILPARWFDGHTFSSLTIQSGYTDDASTNTAGTTNFAPGGHLAIGAAVTVDLGNGGSFSFTGKRADIDGTIRAPGGSVRIDARDAPSPGSTEVPTVRLGATGLIDVAGRWANDRNDVEVLPALDGGSVTIRSSEIDLERGSLVDVSGGARLDPTGTKVTAGKGGSITLDVTQPTRPEVPRRAPYDGKLVLDGIITGFGFGAGGALTLATPYDVYIGASVPASASPSTSLLVSPEFFTQGGFSAFTILGERGVTVTAGTTVAPVAETLVLPDRAAEFPTGTRIIDWARREVLADGRRAPASLTLSTVPLRSIPHSATDPMPGSASVSVETGATIVMDPGSTVRLSSAATAFVDGTISAPGGVIEVSAADLGLGHVTPSVRLGAHAQLLAPGWIRSTPDGALVRRSVEAGGSISLVSAGTVLVDRDAVLDVSGVPGVADLPSAAGGGAQGARYEAHDVDGAAGSISVAADGGGVVAGSLRLAPGGATGAGGTLTIRDVVGPVVVRQSAPDAFGPVTASSLAPADLPRLTVVADAVNASGADSLVLTALRPENLSLTNPILFDGDVTLRTRRALELDATQIGTTDGARRTSVELDSSYVLLKGGRVTDGAVLLGGTPTSDLTVKADLIDLANPVWLGCRTSGCTLGGFATARFVSTGDVRLSDRDSEGVGIAGLFSTGALEFDAAQVYVASRLQATDLQQLERPDGDPGFLVQSAKSITITGNGGQTPVPLSFGERVTLRAPVVVQGGVLRAPQGQIALEGSESVTLKPGSLTSASLEGQVVPFGSILAGGGFRGYDAAGLAPTKSVRLQGASVSVEKNAVIDVSGGGDLLGYTFIPGNGGSRDVLASGGFAVLPSLGAAPAPLGGVASLQDGRLRVGDVVWLQGVPGLAAGYYTLLPAHYALLPGGLYVQPLGGGFASAPGAATRADGAAIASGYRAVSGTPVRDAAWSRFAVMSNDVFGKYTTFSLSSFDDLARATAADAGATVRAPDDAGTAVLLASQNLVLEGTGKFGAGPDRLLGNLDVSAPRIAVVSAGVAPPDASYLELDPQSLQQFGAGSVLLGGTRSATSSGTAVHVSASDVVVELGAGATWTGPEILLAATSSIDVRSGSVLRAEGEKVRDTSPLLLSGDGALLRVSTGDRVEIGRTGATGAAGDLGVGAATLSAAGSLSLDGSRAVQLSPDATLAANHLDLASVRVNLGAAPGGTPGTTLDVAALERIASASDLLLRGHDSIHVYGALELGSRDAGGTPALKSVTLDTGLLQGHGDAGTTARITAGTLTLQNGGAASGAGDAGSATLVLDVDTLNLGPGAVRVAGYASLQGTAGSIAARGAGGLTVGGDLALAAGGIGAGAGADYALDVAGSATITSRQGATPPALGALGGRLALSAAALTLDAPVILPAGSFQVTTRTGDLHVGANARIDVSGAAVDFQDQVRFAPGGSIELDSAGALAIDAGSKLDVSGSDRGGDAGRISLSAARQVSIAGDLRGVATSSARGGSFGLDAGTIASGADIAPLIGTLASGGFERSVSITVTGQDLQLATADRLRAHDVVLRSDGGRVAVAGAIDASGTAESPSGGVIRLEGRDGVSVLGTATLDAHAGEAAPGGFDPASGRIELVASAGRVDVAAGSTLDVSGGRSGGGVLVLRAPRTATGNDVDLGFAGTVRGARDVVVQGVKEYQASAVDAALAGTIVTDGTAWLAGADAIRARLGLTGASVGAGAVVRSAGDLSIQSDLAPNGALGAGYVALVAAGDIDVAAAVSDGFDAAGRAASLSSGRSSTIELDAGRDVTLHPNAMIRTGTGDLSIRAGRDLTLLAPASAQDAPPVIYTAGARTGPAAGFLGGRVGEFPSGGGDVTIDAGRDVVMPFQTQTTSAWLFRDGATTWSGDTSTATVTRQTSWSVMFPNFQQGIGALGGGDVRVTAGRDAVQAQVAIPTTGQLTTAAGSVAHASDLVVRGGGDLEVRAGRDVLGGLFVLGRGHADVVAGGRVAASDQLVGLRIDEAAAQSYGSSKVGALFGLMDATANVVAGSTVEIEGVFDPMLQGQIAQNLAGADGTGFSGYSERAAFSATSLGGSVTYASNPWASADVASPVNSVAPDWQVQMSGAGGLNAQFSRAPGTLRFTALQGSVSLVDRFADSGGGTLRMSSAANGDLELLAAQDVNLPIAIQMEDVAPQYRRGPLAPFSTTGDRMNVGTSQPVASTNGLRGFTPIHAGDPDPVRIYALAGSVCADRSGACAAVALPRPSMVVLPKPLELYAGRDAFEGNYQAQNNAPDAISSVRAGRDVYEVALSVTGAGSAVIEAGRDVVENIRFANGVTNVAGGLLYDKGDNGRPNAVGGQNQALPRRRAADLYVLAGTASGVDWDAFAAAYLDPGNRQGVVRTYLPELATYMSGLGYGGLSGADLVAAFGKLPLVQREMFLERVYFTELKETGIDYNQAGSPRYHSYDRGFRAVSLLFPGKPGQVAGGDVILNSKPAETWSDGSITILAPYGRVAVGSELFDTTGDGGIVTRRGGDIRIMADGNIDLFTSRVFTLQGGDITMWTSDGSITAGAGAKTSVFTVPLTYTMTNDGVIAVNVFGLQTGAGIGVLDAAQDASRPRSRLDLIAPRGEVNAGDAGIRVFGDLNIAAQVVVGLENIQATGATAGVPVPEAPNVSAITTATQVAQAAAQEGAGPGAAAAARNTLADLPSIITVEVVGYETTTAGDADAKRKKRTGNEATQ